MKLPIGLLVYWVHRVDEDSAIMLSIWYYKEMYVPQSIEEKKHSIVDLKEKRCTVLNVSGSYDQIMDLIIQGDKFFNGETVEIEKFEEFETALNNSPKEKPFLFDNIYKIEGSALILDTIVEIDEDMDDIRAQIASGKTVIVNISESWSFENDILGALEGVL